ncbi:MAG TPA: hypothetical protein VGO08_20875 [Burkholderiales bacterium]|jgi:hypothetical protein|nr:hypothetical protein [Burkholderiales bacterium]
MAFFNKPEKSPPSPRVRRIVNDVIYDNAKAECVASHMKRRSSGAWKYFSQEILYRSSQGNWFFVLGQRLHVEQQPEVFIQPASAEQAYAWLCEYNEIDLLERYFPDKAKYA